MQAAFEAGLSYAQERKVFGAPVFDYQLSKVKLARMAALIQAGRQFSYDVAGKMARGVGTLEASMVKAYVCRAAEWVTREAMQLQRLATWRARSYASSDARAQSSKAPMRPSASRDRPPPRRTSPENLELACVASVAGRIPAGQSALRRIPARSPRETTLTATLRDASSIISSPNITAPLRSPSVVAFS